MADAFTREIAWFELPTRRTPPPPEAHVVHEYDRLKILEISDAADLPRGRSVRPDDVTRTEAVGLAAFRRRNSESYRRAKSARPFDGRTWDEPSRAQGEPLPLDCALVPQEEGSAAEGGPMEAPLIPRLAGKVAVASVFVSGPGNLIITDQQADALSAEVLDGLSLLRGFAPERDVIFTHHVMQKTVNAAQAPASTPTRLQPGNRLNVEPFEVGWRDAVFADLDLPAGAAGVRSFTQQLRSQTGSDWAFMVFFTKYRLAHYAYAMNNRKISMGLSNEGFWGGNTDRVFAHETGHIFGAPDEYGSCVCGETHGPFDVPNVNCVNCAGGGTTCLMRSNAGILCRATSYHLGFNGLSQPPSV